LGEDEKDNRRSISQYSINDADAYIKYEAFLGQVRELLQPLIDNAPPNPFLGNFRERIRAIKTILSFLSAAIRHRHILIPFYEFFTGPAQQILDRYFESDILKATLASDAVIGAMVSPRQNGSAYVLLHHVMGEAAGKKGVWAYVQGGMGAVSDAIASVAKKHGADIITNAEVMSVLCNDSAHSSMKDLPYHRAVGVQLKDGSQYFADVIVSNATPYRTFLEWLPPEVLTQTPPAISQDYINHIRHADYSCGSMKINCVVQSLPNFSCFPSPADGSPGPMHMGTTHLNYSMQAIEEAYLQAVAGKPATRPVIELTIPTSLDKTLCVLKQLHNDKALPSSYHIVQLFIQFVPYDVCIDEANRYLSDYDVDNDDKKLLKNGSVSAWDIPRFKEAFVTRCFDMVDEFCPGFSQSIIYKDVLTPVDLERVFGLHKGSISHGSFALHQLAYARPVASADSHSSYRTPLKGLYLCGAGTHPGGGVMGAAGRNCANTILDDSNTFRRLNR